MPQPERKLDVNEYGITPNQAKNRLAGMGYHPNVWSRIMTEGLDGEKFGSHEVRALIIIALGEEPRILSEVYGDLRQQDGLPKDRKG